MWNTSGLPSVGGTFGYICCTASGPRKIKELCILARPSSVGRSLRAIEEASLKLGTRRHDNSDTFIQI